MNQTSQENLSSSGALRAWIEAAHRKKDAETLPRGSAAVLIPILIRDGSYHVLYEVRAAKLHTQPGEICFPGGRIEEGEEPLEAAVREVTEELCVRRDQIEVVGKLDETIGPGAVPFFAYIGVLHGYRGTWSRAEVERVFTVPLDWILTHDPVVYRVRMDQRLPEDFPYEYVPGGRDYKWRSQYYPVPFYPDVRPSAALAEAGSSVMEPGAGPTAAPDREKADGAKARRQEEGMTAVTKKPEAGAVSDPVLWGVTARVTHSLARLLRAPQPL